MDKNSLAINIGPSTSNSTVLHYQIIVCLAAPFIFPYAYVQPGNIFIH